MSSAPDWGSLATLATLLLGLGWRTFWQAGLVAAVLFVAFKILTRVPAGARMLLWWLVCLKFVLGLAWVQPIPLPVLTPAVEIAQSFDSAILSSAPLAGDAAPQPDNSLLTRPWLEYGAMALAALWLAGLAVQGPILVGQLVRARALRRRAQPVGGEVRQQFDELARQAGLRRIPDLRASNEIHTPHVCGLWRPAVLIPEGALTQWSPAEITMTLGHELVHVRFKDLWHGLVPSIAARLFFFHPLARLAAREYGLAREAACDAQTLALTGAEPADYAQLLLRFGVTSRTATTAVAGASPTFQMLKRRLDMLKDSQTRTAPWRWWGAALIVGLMTLPFQLTARDAGATSSPDVEAAEAAPPDPESSPTAAQQPTEAARGRLQRTLEELSELQRDVEKSDLANIQREMERRRRLEALAMEQAKEQYQRELERTKGQWESAAREYERVTRQQQLQGAVEAMALQRQLEAEAVRGAQDAASQGREAAIAALVRELESQKERLEQKLREAADQHVRATGTAEFLQAQQEEVKKRLEAVREQLKRQQAGLDAEGMARLERMSQELERRVRERTASDALDLSSRLRNVENEVRRLADLLEKLRDQLVPKK
jgi:beta-lactamase regulating signal transducer with metallopeptidase domain